MKKTTIVQELQEQGQCLIQTVGVSMEPLLHMRQNTVVLRRVDGALRKNDVVCFLRQSADSAEPEYVLHRIIKVGPDSCLIRGDNCLQNEYVENKNILGVMTGYFSGDEYIDCANDRRYRRYVRLVPFRYAARKGKIFVKRVIRKCLKW